jgi:signal peptidase II
MSRVSSYRAWFWSLAVIGLTLDLGSKHLIAAWLPEQGEKVLVPGWLSLIHQTHRNQGALFGVANNHGHVANYAFAVVSAVVALIIIGWAMRRATAGDRVMNMALGLILCGALGNLYDRIAFEGVRDWIWAYYTRPDGSRMSWPIFNVADSCLVCGACLLLLQAFFKPQTASESAPASEQAKVPAA